MDSYSEGTGYDLQHPVDDYPWEIVGNGTVVDVGLRDTNGCQLPASSLSTSNPARSAAPMDSSHFSCCYLPRLQGGEVEGLHPDQ